ncbi:RIO1 family regulatory kinase/ATPase [Trujillonella humicola]|uniref:RIO1 family regulatory kinase/ATPase domain-containing protein n=1 Tax=Trujillonella humicola TaxID=3383699 RepID=UPI0039061AEF
MTDVRPAAPGRPIRRPSWPAGGGARRPSGRDRLHGPVPGPVWAWGAAAAAAAVLLVVWSGRPGGLPPLDRAATDLLVPGGRRPDLAADLARLGTELGYRTLWLPTSLVLVWTARWRHLLVYLGSISAVAAVAQLAVGEAVLVRAVREEVTGSPEAFDLSAWPEVVLATVAVGTLYVLTPSGRARRWGWAAVVALLALCTAPRIALGADDASTAVASAVLGCGIAVITFTLLAPEPAFPVTYRRRVKAHLALDPPRTARIRAALRDQLGLELASIEPYRLDGSAGSTPCRLILAGGPPEVLFGKLYSLTHLRSDRWYKLFRVLRYGRLEDEAPFSSVRRLVEHEDYMLRLLRDGGVRVPAPVGVVEVVPGREYLLVTEFVPGAVEVLDSGMGEAVLDDALHQVRQLWAAGAAHRDVKPSNVLARDDRVVLVDVSFGELRPSRWRQAVDLANMLLICALAADPDRVRARARRLFTDEELAEAFATTNSLTVPRQLRRRMEDDGRDLVALLRRGLPVHPRIRVQRWSARRMLLALGTVGGALLTAWLVALNLRAGGLL